MFHNYNGSFIEGLFLDNCNYKMDIVRGCVCSAAVMNSWILNAFWIFVIFQLELIEFRNLRQ